MSGLEERTALNRFSRREWRQAKRFGRIVISALEGRRIDPLVRGRHLGYYGGVTEVTEVFSQTEGNDRRLFIKGLGWALDESGTVQDTKAEIIEVFVNSAHGLTQLGPAIDRISQKTTALSVNLTDAIGAYRSYRELVGHLQPSSGFSYLVKK